MVKLEKIRQWNACFAKEQHAELVGVFAGATGGIGASTLETMVQTLPRSTFYVLGRSPERFVSQRAKLERLNPSAKVVFIQGDLTLLSNVDAACKQIAAAEDKVDYLYMSPGIISGEILVNGPQYTKEGLENCFAISYYSRMRLVSNLLPLLRHSPRPRVLSVLNGGRETRLLEHDIGLEKNWSLISVGGHTTTMTSLAFEHLAASNKQIAFMHSFPGMVKTDVIARMIPPESSGLLWRVSLASFRGIGAAVMGVFGMEAKECGDRQAFLLTTDKYGPGSWRIESSSQEVSAPGVLQRYRESGWKERIWEHTLGVFDKAREGESNGTSR